MPRLFLRMLAPLGMAFGLYVNNAVAGRRWRGSLRVRTSITRANGAGGRVLERERPGRPRLLSVRRWRRRPHRRPRWPMAPAASAPRLSRPGLRAYMGPTAPQEGVSARQPPRVLRAAHRRRPTWPRLLRLWGAHRRPPTSQRPLPHARPPAPWALPILARLPHPASRAFMASEGAAAPSRRAASDVGERAERVGRPVRPTGIRRSNPGQATDRSAQDFRRRRPSGRRPSVRRRGRPRAHRGQ